MAYGAASYILFGIQNGVGKFPGFGFGQAQHIKGQALGTFAADAGQLGKLLDQFFKRGGKVFHGDECSFCWGYAPRRAAMRAGISAALYTALPATSTLAPAAMATGAVSGSMPPSTSKAQAGFWASI